MASTSTPRYAAIRPSSITLCSALSDHPMASPVHSAKAASSATATQPRRPNRVGSRPANALSSTTHHTATPASLRTTTS